MSSITALPAELITQIADNVHPADAVNFACGNPLLQSCSSGRLQECKHMAVVLQCLHDREPLTLLRLFRLFKQRPDLAFFVRTFEIWAVRVGPKDWQWENLRFERPDYVYEDDSDDDNDGDEDHDVDDDAAQHESAENAGTDLSAGRSGEVAGTAQSEDLQDLVHNDAADFSDNLTQLAISNGIPHHGPRFDYSQAVLQHTLFTPNDYEHVRQVLQTHLNFTEDLATQWLANLHNGNDESLKLAVMALCPQLQKITFVNLRELDEDDDWEERSPFTFLNEAIRSLYHRHSPQRPWPAFQNVREVVTGEEYYKRYTVAEGYYHPEWHEVASLLLLPSLEKITFDAVGLDKRGGRTACTYEWEWPGTKSTVKHLVFKEDCTGSAKTLTNLISNFHALQTIAGPRWHGVTKDQYIDALAQYQAHALQYFDIVSTQRYADHGVTAEGLSQLARFEHLTEISFAITDFLEEHPDHTRYDLRGVQWTWPETQSPRVQARFVDILPPCVKAIRVSGRVWRPNPRQCEIFVASLEELILKKEQGRVQHLAHVCVWSVMTSLHHTARLDASEYGFGLAMSGGVDSFDRRPDPAAELIRLKELCATNGVDLHAWKGCSGVQTSDRICCLCDRPGSESEPKLPHELHWGWRQP